MFGVFLSLLGCIGVGIILRGHQRRRGQSLLLEVVGGREGKD